MRYMLMMNVPAGTGEYQIGGWAPEDFKAHIAFMHRYNKELKDAGEFVDGQGLTPPSQAKLVRAGKKGEPITDGPFAESKEFLAGFWLIDVDSPDRAYALAAKASAAPGPGGAPLNMAIEVRPVLAGPPPDV
ncbi:MAG: YciI family protein [Gemmatimonadales bacterium]